MYGLILVIRQITDGKQWFFESDENGNVSSWMDLDCDIYATESQANKSHEEMVEKWKNM